MKKYKTNIDRPDISSREITGFRDFQSVLNGYRNIKKPFYRTKGFRLSAFMAAAAIIAIVAFIALQNGSFLNRVFVAESHFANRDFDGGSHTGISPPFKSFNIPYKKFHVDASAGDTIIYHTGTEVHIPKRAFVDKNGNPVTGEVEIQYREMHTPADFFISGIPLEYDSGGTKYAFESAGMMEMLAFRENDTVYLHPDKEVDVLFASAYEGTDYNVYYYDKKQKNWVYKGKDEVMKPTADTVEGPEYATPLADEEPNPNQKAQPLPEEEKRELASIEQEVEQIKKAKPVKPQKANPQKPAMRIDVNAAEFPEIAVYENMLFEFTNDNKEVNPNDAHVVWSDVKVEKWKRGTYRITFSTAEKSVQYVVKPVFEGRSYKDAMKVFHEKYEEYEAKLADKKAAEKRQRRQYEKTIQEQSERRSAYEKLMEERERRMRETADSVALAWQQQNATTRRFIRAFSIDGLGIWNCDAVRRMPGGNVVSASFVDDNQNHLNLRKVYLVQKNRNQIISYSKSQLGNFEYDPGRRNMLWAVTPENRLAVFTYDDFRGVPNRKGPYTFQMTVVDREFNSTAEIQETLHYLNKQGTLPPESEQAEKPDTENTADIDIHVYPNPVENTANITLSREEDYTVEIVDASGTVMQKMQFKGKSAQCDLSRLAGGTYIVRVCTKEGDKQKSVRIIKR